MAVVIAATAAILVVGTDQSADEAQPDFAVLAESGSEIFLAENGSRTGVETTESGLQYEILGSGDDAGSPSPTDYVLVNYEGRIPGGETFDSGQQVPMPLAGVVPGFAEGIQLMSRGARHRIWLPPALGYGDTPPTGGPIEADTVMEFDVELIDFITMEQFEAVQREAQREAAE